MKLSAQLLTAILAIVLVFSLCACGTTGGNSGTQSADRSSSPAETPAQSQPSSAQPGTDPVPGDGEALPLTTERSSFSVFYGVHDFMAPIERDISKIYILNEIEKMTNVYIEFTQVPAESMQEQFPIMIASNDWCDCISDVPRQYAGGIDKAVDDQVIQDIGDYIREYCPNLMARMEADETLSKGMLSSSGYITYFPTINNTPDPGPTNGYVIRQDWLDTLGLSMPRTYDQLHEVLTAFKNEYDATMFVAPDFVNVENYFAAGFDISGGVSTDMGDKFGLIQIDGVVKCSILEPGYREFLQLMNQWWNEGLIDDTYGDYFMEFIQDHYGNLLDGTNGVSQADSDLIRQLREMSDDPNYHIVAMADVGKTEDQMLHVGNPRTIMNGGNSGTWFVTTSAQDPALIARFANFMYSDEAVQLCNYGTEGYTYYVADDGTYHYTDLITNNEDGYSIAQMLHSYLAHNTSPFPWIKIVDREFYNLTEDQYDAIVNIWASNNDCAYNIPFYVQLNAQETERYNELAGDLSTYVSENHLAFITGTRSFDEFDDFIAQCRQLGAEEIASLYQAAWDRTMK